MHLEDLRRIKIFIPLPEVELGIRELVRTGVSYAQQAHESYCLAQQMLENELELTTLVFDKPVGYTAYFSELESTRRSDAQHYQPCFDQLLEHLTKFKTRKIRDIRTNNRRGIQPIYVKNGDHAVVNSQHLGPKHINYDGLQKTSQHHYAASPEAHIRLNDLLIYTTGAYLSLIHI